MLRSVAYPAPTTEPIALSEAKRILDIAQSVTGHDAEILDSIVAARELWERDTGRLTVSRTCVEDLDTWPDECFRFYYQPVSSITTIKYYDTSNSQQTLASSVYRLDAPERKIFLDVDQVWPDHETREDAIELTYVAGESLVAEVAKRAMYLLIKINFSDLSNEATDKHWKAYRYLVENYQRASYP